MKKIASALFAAVIVASISGCSSPSQGGTSENQGMDQGFVSSSNDEVTTNPFGGQCPILGQPVLDTLGSLGIAGAASFEGSLDRLNSQTSSAGYRSIYDWTMATESLIIGPLNKIDLTVLTSNERSTIEALIKNFNEPGTMSYGMDWAILSANSDWYLDTHSKLISVGADCEGHW
ncbi:MAG: hypothetical protein RLZ06_116 [Actinomycetota bacterium]|jgi:hypothetical protein